MSKFNANGLTNKQQLILIGQSAFNSPLTVIDVADDRKSVSIELATIATKRTDWLPTLDFRFNGSKLVARLHLEDVESEDRDSIASEWANGAKLRKRIAKLAKRAGLKDKVVKSIIKFLDSLKG